MASSSDSSPSVKSQLSYAEDFGDYSHDTREIDETTPALDAFAPGGSVVLGRKQISKTKAGSHEFASRMAHPGAMRSIAAGESTQQGILHALGHKQSEHHTVDDFSQPTMAAKLRAPIQPLSAPVFDTQDDDLTQIQLMPPTVATGSARGFNQPNTEDTPQSKDRRASAVQNKNLALEYGIEIDSYGRITTRMCRVPQEQRELLDSDNKWVPPLVGSAIRNGTVPLDLLNILAAAADNKSTRQMTVPDNPISKAISQHKHLPETDSDQSDDTASEVGSKDWPDSSPLAPVVDPLPPNSSPLLDVRAFSQPQSHSVDQAYSHRGTKSLTSTPRDEDEQSALDKSYEMEGAALSQQRPAHPAEDVDETGDGPFAKRNEQNSGPNSSTDAKVSQPPQGIEVSRTPYPTRREPVSGALFPSTYVIPGTFDDSTLVTSVRRQGRHEPETVANGLHSSEFEKDSSEDEASHDRRATHSQPLGKSQSSVSQLSSSLSELDPDKLSRHVRSGPTGKRHASEANISDRQERKRSRGRQEKILTYAEVDESRRSYRREFFQDLTQKRPSASQKSSPVAPSAGARHTKHLSPALSQSRAQTQRHPKLADTREPATDLYTTFTKAYPTYSGKQEHFIAALKLLKESLPKSPVHPSLWDAFIFRHHHDYRLYLHKIIESSGTALSYVEFFDTIDDPGCHVRVITRAALQQDTPELPPASKSKSHDVGADRNTPQVMSKSVHGPSIQPSIPTDRQRRQETRLTTGEGDAGEALDVDNGQKRMSKGSTRYRFDATVSKMATDVAGPQHLTREAQRHDSNTIESIEVIAFRPSPRKPRVRESNQSTPERSSPKTKTTSTRSSTTRAEDNPPATKARTKSDAKARPASNSTTAQRVLQQVPKRNEAKRRSGPDIATIDTTFKQFARDYDNLVHEQSPRGSGVRDGHATTQGKDNGTVKESDEQQTFIDIFRWTRR